MHYRAAAKPSSGRKGDRDSGGRSPRDLKFRLNFIVTHSPSPDFVGSSLPEGAFGLCAPKVRLLFLTSTAFVSTNANQVICLALLGVIFSLRESDIAPDGRSDILFALVTSNARSAYHSPQANRVGAPALSQVRQGRILYCFISGRFCD